MTDSHPPEQPDPADRAGPRPGGPLPIDPALVEHLQLLADGITDLVGFRAAIINIARSETMVVAAVSGMERAVSVRGVEHTRDEMIGIEWPVAVLLDDIGSADDWGRFKFIPHDRGSDADGFGWIPDLPVSDDPDAWHPHDMLIAPIRDAGGKIRGSLAVDEPLSGRIPDERQRRHLERYARIAERVVLLAADQHELAERHRLASAARAVFREASSTLSVEHLLETSGELLMGAFGLAGVWARVFDGSGADYPVAVIGVDLPYDPDVAAVVEDNARDLWVEGGTAVVTPDHVRGLRAPHPERLRAYVADLGFSSVLLVPVGAGHECLGSLSLARAAGSPMWSEVELSEVIELGRDLGRFLATARAFQHEEQLVRELQELDSDRRQLVAMVSHELKNPLTSARVNLELLERFEVDPAVTRGIEAARRGLRRMEDVIADLLLLARADGMAEAGTADAGTEDLGATVREVCELTADWARTRGVTLVTDLADDVHVPGDAEQIRRVAGNLVSNAVKYSVDGGIVTVAVRVRDGDRRLAELVVADDGIGMTAEDQKAVFGEFFRSSDPEVQRQGGTGLGLAIVAKVARHLGGEVGVDSELGRGSTFWVQLPRR